MSLPLLSNKRTILASVVGSHAHGMATASSDVDLRTVYLVSPLRLVSPFHGMRVQQPPTNLHGEPCDTESWELSQFLLHLTKGNPSMFEVLISSIRAADPIVEELDQNIDRLRNTRAIRAAHLGYADQQIERYLKKARSLSEFTLARLPKCTVSAIRALYQGIRWLENREFYSRLPDDMVRYLLELRQNFDYSDIPSYIGMIESWKSRLEEAYARTTPEDPDYDWIIRFIHRTYSGIDPDMSPDDSKGQALISLAIGMVPEPS